METTGTVTTRDERTLAYSRSAIRRLRSSCTTTAGPVPAWRRACSPTRPSSIACASCAWTPRIGRSSPQKERAWAGWADDLTAIADAMGRREFGVTGWSEGGPWALAAAAYVDAAPLRRVSNVAGGCYGAFGDDWAADHLSAVDALGGFLALHFEPGFRLLYAALGVTAAHFGGTFVEQLRQAVNPYDASILAAAAIEEALCASTAACFAPGSDGLVRDAELLYRC